MDVKVLAEIVIIAVAALSPLMMLVRYVWRLESNLYLTDLKVNRIENFLTSELDYHPTVSPHGKP